jgi:murein DD-endopeptidase MepM/ murein hydrolase activator NlpD
MVNPVPGRSITTGYGIRGGSWRACGWHTGVDFAAPNGTPVVAAVSGTIRHRSYGSSFGPYQFAISPSDGQPFADQEVFYAHVLSRLPDGTEVTAGQTISKVGALGNATGPHLHFELHARKNLWSCNHMLNPQPAIDWQPSTPPHDPADTGPVYLDKLHYGQKDSDSVRALQRALNGHRLDAPGNITLPITGNYLGKTDEVVRACQVQHGFGHDAPGTSFVGRRQAEHLGLRIVG